MEQKEEPALVYARSLWANILAWYNNADTKAQVLLALNGAFIGFLSSSVFMKAEDLAGLVSSFGAETWVFAAALVLALLGSVLGALLCLWSRMEDPNEIRRHLDSIVQDKEGRIEQDPETMYFFGHIAQLPDRKRFEARMARFQASDEIRALSSQIFLVSRNVLKKHVWVNRGFVLAGAALVFFLLTAVSYAARVAFH
jgi:hypothetical protein